MLELSAASLALKNADPALRAKAAAALAKSNDPQVRQVLSALVGKGSDGTYAEPDERVRSAAQLSLAEINRRLFSTEIGLAAFTGLSLGSILLLAALGLAITYGLMGIINMAHGEFLMIGAYTTYLTQGVFRQYLPGAFDWYVVAALPAAFIVTALIGMAPYLLEIVGLKGRGNERVGGYSRGMKQRLHVARTLLHDPDILFLD